MSYQRIIDFSAGVGGRGEARFFELEANGKEYAALRAAADLDASFQLTLPDGLPSQDSVILVDSTGAMSFTQFPLAYAKVSDVKANGVPGGTFVSALWQTRDLNTIDEDDDSLLSLSLNQITLIAGTYYTKIRSPSLRVQSNICQLANIDLGTAILFGTNEYSSPPGFGSHAPSQIMGVFTIAVDTVMEVQHQCFRTQVTHGFGGSVLTFDLPLPPETYTIAEFWRFPD